MKLAPLLLVVLLDGTDGVQSAAGATRSYKEALQRAGKKAAPETPRYGPSCYESMTAGCGQQVFVRAMHDVFAARDDAEQSAAARSSQPPHETRHLLLLRGNIPLGVLIAIAACCCDIVASFAG